MNPWPNYQENGKKLLSNIDIGDNLAKQVNNPWFSEEALQIAK